MNRKPSRFKKKERAQWEIGVVKECRDDYDDMIEQERLFIRENTAKIKTLEEKIKACEDMDTCEALYACLDSYRNDLDLCNHVLEQYMQNRRILGKLVLLLEANFTSEHYAYIIRKIPERTLPKMVKSQKAGQMGKVYDLVYRLYSDLNSHIEEIREIDHMTEKDIKALDEARNIRESTMRTEAEQEAIRRGIEEIKRGSPKPIPTDEE